ncbi:MAG: NAD(P)-binding domain-containing protein [Thermoanaerobaculia bacterium]|nr:NAD(P)-binding domain-containing protein [Thermoanaerobaculia bacterium]
MSSNRLDPQHDLIIIGGGIGGIISLKYAKDAGLDAILLEKGDAVGGLWRDLPAWQDLQIRKEDWTLGDLPIAGENQASVLANIREWIDRFNLAPSIRLGTRVRAARSTRRGWRVHADGYAGHSRFLIAATGGHNRPVVPQIERAQATLTEYHSSTLRDPSEVTGKDVVVVGGGASAFDLLDLCLEHKALSVTWVYRSLKWMLPTLRRKYYASNLRSLARMQMLGIPAAMLNKRTDRNLRNRYRKAGLDELTPDRSIDLGHQMLIPGRRRMVQDLEKINRHKGEIVRIDGDTVRLSSGRSCRADLVLWGTGYETDLSYLEAGDLSRLTSLAAIKRRCGAHFLALDAPNLFLLAPGVLETITSTPWAYAHAAKSIISHIRGNPVFDSTPVPTNANYFDMVRFLAKRDRGNYPRALWYLKYLSLAFRQSSGRPLPIP